jgi:hypothetical protein
MKLKSAVCALLLALGTVQGKGETNTNGNSAKVRRSHSDSSANELLHALTHTHATRCNAAHMSVSPCSSSSQQLSAFRRRCCHQLAAAMCVPVLTVQRCVASVALLLAQGTVTGGLKEWWNSVTGQKVRT